jgi:hypothetical protein
VFPGHTSLGHNPYDVRVFPGHSRVSTVAMQERFLGFFIELKVACKTFRRQVLLPSSVKKAKQILCNKIESVFTVSPYFLQGHCYSVYLQNLVEVLMSISGRWTMTMERMNFVALFNDAPSVGSELDRLITVWFWKTFW